MELQPYVWEGVIALITVLGSINAYFISRLINRIDKSASAVEEFSRQLAVLTSKVEQLSDMQHRLVVLEKQVSVFEFVIKSKTRDEA